MNLKLKRGSDSSNTLTVIKPALDYPRRNEKITSKHYTFRISVSGPAKNVELSINQGPWLSCRNSVGYWWCDWFNYGRGGYKAVVRAQTAGGQKVNSETYEFFVDTK